MSLFHKLSPKPLKNLNQQLLENSPFLWSTRIHYWLYFAFLGNLLAALIGFVYPVSINNLPDVEVIFGLTFIPAIVVFAIWVYKVVLYSVEKQFGKRNPLQSLAELYLYFVSIALFFSFSYTLGGVISYRVNHLIDSEELVQDINHLNIGNHYFPSYVSNYKTYSSINDYLDYGYHNLIDEDLREIKERYGSYEDNYKTYNTNLGAYSPWYYSDEEPPGLLSQKELLANYLKDKSDFERMEEISNFIAIINKYGGRIEVSPEQVLSNYKRWVNNIDLLMDNYNLERTKDYARDIIYNHSRAKTQRYFFFREEGFFYFLFVLTFFLTVLLTIFKSVNWKPFLVAIVAMIIVPILLGIFDELGRRTFGSGNFFLGSCVVIYLFLLIQTLIATTQTKYIGFNAVCLIILNLLTPIFPFIVAIAYVEITGYGYYHYNDYYPYHGYNAQDIIEWCFWGGIILYGTLLHPLFKRMYIKLRSIPRKK